MKKFIIVEADDPHYERYFFMKFLFELYESKATDRDPEENKYDRYKRFWNFYTNVKDVDLTFRMPALMLGALLVSAWELPLSTLKKVHYLDLAAGDLWDFYKKAFHKSGLLDEDGRSYLFDLLASMKQAPAYYCNSIVQDFLSKDYKLQYVLVAHPIYDYLITIPEHLRFEKPIKIRLTAPPFEVWFKQNHVGFSKVDDNIIDQATKDLYHDKYRNMTRHIETTINTNTYLKFSKDNYLLPTTTLEVTNFGDIDLLIKNILKDGKK